MIAHRRPDPRQTPLQRHAAFFDHDGDGLVHLDETRAGLCALGLPWALAAVLAPVINAALGPRTGGGPTTIDVGRILQGKHAFDSGTFDAAGAFDPVAFDRLFAEASGGRAHLTKRELVDFVFTNPGGQHPDHAAVLLQAFSWLEATVFFCLAGTPREGGSVVTKRRLRSFYEGRLFYALERRSRLVRAGRLHHFG
jgi:peroxygenase